jgi:hypothetical protein
MFTIWGRQHTNCGRRSRREFLRVGGLGAFGISLPGLLRAEAQAATAAGKRPKSVIYIVLNGGPSHIDTWDPKPEAPIEYRGDFGTIPTKIPGARLCELFPRQAEMLDRLALIRGVRSVENDHFLSEVYTGLPRTSGQRPAFGSVVSRLAAGHSALPPYVCLDQPSDGQFQFEKPHYAGASKIAGRSWPDLIACSGSSIPLVSTASIGSKPRPWR